jgi:predicted transcriptional regulator of viral defense system
MRSTLAGLGKKERQRLAQLLKAGLPTITSQNASRTLAIDQHSATQLLARWCKKGWLSRVKHGVYIPISIQSETPDVMVDEPWVLAKALFAPGYIGGWSAAEHWDLTEQIFHSTMVFSTKKVHGREQRLKGATFTIKTIKPEKIFGVKSVWLQSQKVEVSDPTRTIVDAFNDPAVVGGVRMAMDILDRYLKSEHKDLSLLFEYSMRAKNTAIFKRLGFVFSEKYSEHTEIIIKMKKKIKSGYSQLDPSSPGKKLVTAWNLWIPIKGQKAK